MVNSLDSWSETVGSNPTFVIIFINETSIYKKNALLILDKKIGKRFKSQNWNFIVGGVVHFDNVNCNLIKHIVKEKQKI